MSCQHCGGKNFMVRTISPSGKLFITLLCVVCYIPVGHHVKAALPKDEIPHGTFHPAEYSQNVNMLTGSTMGTVVPSGNFNSAIYRQACQMMSDTELRRGQVGV